MIKKEQELSNLSVETKQSNYSCEEVQLPLGFVPTSRQQLCGDIGMYIDSHGTWHYQGSPIKRKELVKLFSKVLHCDPLGNHWLITPTEIARVHVDDVAFVVVEMNVNDLESNQIISFRTSIDTTYNLSKAYPLRVEVNPETKEPAPYLVLDQGLEAKLSRSVFFSLANLAVEEKIEEAHVLGIWSADIFHIIGEAP